jgi:hypothetical protein
VGGAPGAYAQAPDTGQAGAAAPAVAPTPAPAVGRTQVTAAEGCTYDVCALRIEEGVVLKGVNGHRVTTPSLLGSLTRDVDWRSDLARQYARRADRRHRTARLLRSAGVLASLAGAGLALQAIHGGRESPGDAGSDGDLAGTARVGTGRIYTAVGLGVGSTLLGWMGNAAARGARQQLARAVWWHNRELVLRSPGASGEL